MKKEFERIIWDFIQHYASDNDIDIIWQRPIVKFADAKDPHMTELKDIVIKDHYLPKDILPSAENVLSYYLPFKEEIGESNVKGRTASEMWANAYRKTNQMTIGINEHLVRDIKEKGYRAAAPKDAGLISDDILLSRWSQRHVAWIAGHGTFGINNMLISEKGCCGRYFSVVTDLPVVPDNIVEEERCLYKSEGICGICAERCVNSALTTTGFDRKKCYEMCEENFSIHNADVCGKCVVGLPCSFRSQRC